MLPKQTSYALKDIFETTMQASLQNAHSALPDARALRDILMLINPYSLSGTICPAYTTPLQTIKWLGASCENYLFMKNVRSIEQLMSLLINSYATHNLLGGGRPRTRAATVKYLGTRLVATTVAPTIVGESWGKFVTEGSSVPHGQPVQA